MFTFVETFDLTTDWYFGNKNKHPERIPNEILKTISNIHIIGIQFLFENFIKKRSGAILNQDEDSNMPLQVCAFLSSFKHKIDRRSFVLIISSEYSLCKWHYHASEVGFEPKIITPNNLEHLGVCLLSSDSIKLAEKLLDDDLFCVVVDDLDVLATKPLIKKFKGSFNVGLTKRNFYKHPDQKLKWSMLNWASPGCVGKLNDFYRIDHLHSLAFADNYRFWWNRLTWNFCDSFEPPKEDDLEAYQRKLKEWGDLHNIRNSCEVKRGSKRTKNVKNPAKRRKSNSGPILLPPSQDEIKPSIPNSEDSECEDLQKVDEEVLHSSTQICVKAEQPTGEKDENVLLNSNPTDKVKTEVDRNVDSDEEEPILSIIYSQAPLATNAIMPNEHNSSESSRSGTRFSSFLEDDTELMARSESFQQISNVLDNLYDEPSNTEDNLDDDSFFSDLISGNK